jgi:hypothetical protein
MWSREEFEIEEVLVAVEALMVSREEFEIDAVSD